MFDRAIDILLVEDDPNDVELTLRTLDKSLQGRHVGVVRDGAEALELLLGVGAPERRLHSLPKLVMLDLKLPKVNGLEVLRAVKADPTTRSIPTVVLTSSKEDRDATECYQLGVNSYVVKPVDFDQFSDAIRQLGLYWLLLNHNPLK